ncbi:type II CAAX prenyl endopeptidase Rce1 family protein [Corynebacterium gottingense]|uniref:CPBP family glutamic-type intramembrane protease n=1 Tax=Corynebacterium gottingense TaxID=2041036 RepID=UPI0038CF4B8E
MTVSLHRTADARPGRSTWVRTAELALLAAFATAFGVAAALAIQLCSSRGILLDDPAQRALFEPLLILAATLPAAPLAAACTGRHPASLVSTTRRIRWPIAGRALALAVGLYAAATAGAVVWARVSGEPAPVSETCSVAMVCALCAVITLQSAAEELVFRAALPQIIGSGAFGRWCAHPAIAYGLPALAFVALHTGGAGTLLDVAVFAACAAWLTWHTDGIEAAWALHLVGNVWVMGASISSGPLGTVATMASAALIAAFTPRR